MFAVGPPPVLAAIESALRHFYHVRRTGDRGRKLVPQWRTVPVHDLGEHMPSRDLDFPVFDADNHMVGSPGTELEFAL